MYHREVCVVQDALCYRYLHNNATKNISTNTTFDDKLSGALPLVHQSVKQKNKNMKKYREIMFWLKWIRQTWRMEGWIIFCTLNGKAERKWDQKYLRWKCFILFLPLNVRHGMTIVTKIKILSEFLWYLWLCLMLRRGKRQNQHKFC